VLLRVNGNEKEQWAEKLLRAFSRLSCVKPSVLCILCRLVALHDERAGQEEQG